MTLLPSTPREERVVRREEVRVGDLALRREQFRLADRRPELLVRRVFEGQQFFQRRLFNNPALGRVDLGGSAACQAAVGAAFAQLEALMEDTTAGPGGGRSRLSALFRTCGLVATEGDCYLLHDYVSDDFMEECGEYPRSDGPCAASPRAACRAPLCASPSSSGREGAGNKRLR